MDISTMDSYESDSDTSTVEVSSDDTPMPTPGVGGTTPRGRGRGRPGSKSITQSSSNTSLEGMDTGRRGRLHSALGPRSARRRRGEEEDNGPETVDPEEKLALLLIEALADHSRQRLRATHMSLRRYGSVENRVSQKDLQLAFTENQIKFSHRLLQMMTEIYEDHGGVDYERLYKCLMAAHLKTGRDSVKARLMRNDLTSKQEMSKEQRDYDFLCRLEDLLIQDRTFFDIEVLRKDFQGKDTNRTGKIGRETVFLVCDMRTPLYGALLKNLLKRCDEDHNDMISWPEFLSFLEKSQQMAWRRCPELAELPEKAKLAAFSIASNPIEELSSGAKTRVVSRLLKKASLQKEKSTLSTISREKSVDESVPQATTTNEQPNPPQQANQPSPKIEPANQKTEPDPVKAVPDSKEKESKDTSVKQAKKSPDDAPGPPPMIEVDKPSDEGSGTPTKQSTQGPPKGAVAPEPEPPLEPDIDESNKHAVTLEVHGKKVKVVQPEAYKDSSLPIDPPQERLQLDWVYGYRGNDCRCNIYILDNDEIIYFISNIAVMYNRDVHTQRHYKEHTEDIKCMAVHSNGNIVATGQYAGKKDDKSQAHIRVWRADTLGTVHVLGLGNFIKAVMCLSFQKDSDLLAAVDNSQEKTLSLWNVADGTHVASTVLHVDVICDIGFNPHHTDLLVSIGKEHLAWWKVYPETNKITTHAKPEYDNYLRAKFVICLTHTDKGDLVTGDSNGTIYVWGDGGNKITNFVKHGHDGPVFTVLHHRHHLVSGGRDGVMYSWQWTKNMDGAGKVEISKSEGGVRMIQIHKETLLLGTTMNSLLSVVMATKGSPLDGATLEMLPLTQGHFDELRGLTTMPQSFIGADFLTAGVDGIICKFSTEIHQPVWKIVMKGATFLCADCSIDGKLLVLGTHDGHLVILGLDAEDLSVTEVCNKKISKDRLDSIRLAPDCASLAVGGHDRAVYIYSLQDKEEGDKAWEMLGKCKGHRGPVTAIDWSREKVGNTHLLRSSSTTPEQFFWNPTTCAREEGKNAVSLSWCTSNCTVDYAVAGIWSSKQAKEATVNTIDVNPNKTVIAMGDNNGCLSLFRYPCPKDGAFSHTYKCHLNVQTVRFSPSGKYVLTIGGRDSCVMQWKIV
ncbi:echinoderm microtubule-associated protein-like 2 isoform X1 [Haliotis rufescens]|uniref:echinoderm microtubule-associated protein-like 2 isoform X1 n=2 Tax=Haliotis rufescens TaxID=6454 RepID=UPI00201E8246|nr:echinoderm microtubule-associated protein-like 2 isoform X1 [Haliotis rufescens]